MSSVTRVTVLLKGYSIVDNENNYHASGTVSLIETISSQYIIVDTGGVLDKFKLLQSLSTIGIEPQSITYVVCTHTHSDHIGNLNLFPSATQIVDKEINIGDIYRGPILTKSAKYVLVPGEVEV